MIVLDASAALAYLLAEPGGDLVREKLSECAITSVNLIEVLKRLRRDLGEAAAAIVKGEFEKSVPNILSVEAADSMLASKIYADFQKSHNIALGDAICLAAGLRYSAEVLTADNIWAQLPDVGRIVVIR